MPVAFQLCAKCVENYRSLVHDPKASHNPCVIPYNCIVWTDEHPSRDSADCNRRDFCRHSLIRLSSARKSLWRTGQIPEDLSQLWQEAQAIIPDWPGFKRLTLSEADLKALDYCESEADGVMNFLRQSSSLFTLSDTGGVCTFVAHPTPPRSPQGGMTSGNGDVPGLPNSAN